MKTNNNRTDRITRSLLAAALVIAVGLVTGGCGEVAGVAGIVSGSNSLMLSWTAPTTNEDGSTLDDLVGYKLYYGNQPGQYSQVVTVGDYTTAEIDNLGSGTYYLSVTAYDIYGNESSFSNEIYHTF
jgi:hypothetical protein